MRMVRVEWIDAEDHDETWVSEQQAAVFADKELLAVSIGFVISDGPKYLTLAGDKDLGNGNWSRICKIPKSVIQKTEDLCVGEGPTEDVK